jgi:hypothetical protein
MKMYLSSYRIGREGAVLSKFVTGKRRIGVVRNALDFSDDTLRLANGKKREFEDLTNLGLCPEELDLRMYFGLSEKLLDKRVYRCVALCRTILRPALIAAQLSSPRSDPASKLHLVTDVIRFRDASSMIRRAPMISSRLSKAKKIAVQSLFHKRDERSDSRMLTALMF